MINSKYKFIFLLLCLIGANCMAQNNTRTDRPVTITPLQFHSINQLGFLEGEVGSAFQIQTINGLQYKSWFAGIGAGIDYYRFRSIPLFIDLRKEFGSSPNRFFVYTGAGMNFIWLTDQQKRDFVADHYGANDFSNGLYFDAGIGYKIKLDNNIAMIISPGFSYKRTEAKTSNTICPFQAPCYIDAHRFDFAMSRLSVNIGLVF